MSRRYRITIFIGLMIGCPFAMEYLHHKFGIAGLFTMLALALLLGLSFFPHVIGED